MVIESIMYFALGFLAAGLLALMVVPSIWARAVRLTKKRIEAATPMTMAEFRADKDQLRAEFALSTRRLEMNVEALRKRLAEQLGDINRKRADLNQIKAERDQQLTIVRELEEREGELRRRVLDLEKESADLAQRLRMRDREVAAKTSELEAIRAGNLGANLGAMSGAAAEAGTLSGAYGADVEQLLAALGAERERSALLEDQVRGLIGRLESADQQSLDTGGALAALRQSLAERDDESERASGELIEAEARIASAESRLNELLAETHAMVSDGESRHERLLAEKLTVEAELEALRDKVLAVESAVMTDWDRERLEQSHLREQLNDIASDVSRLVYALDGEAVSEQDEESLFERVQKFAGDGVEAQSIPVHRPAFADAENGSGGRLAERMAALRDAQAR